MLQKLSEEQKKVMLETRDEWINLFFDNVKEKRGIDKPLFEEGIRWIYEDLLRKTAPKIVYCDSWTSCLLTILILREKKIGNAVASSVRASIWASVWASVGASVGEALRDSVEDSVWDSVWDSVRDSVEASVWASVRASVVASVASSVWASVWASLRNAVWDSVEASVEASVRNAVEDSVEDSVRASVRASVEASVRNAVEDSVVASVVASVGASLRASVGNTVASSVVDSVVASVWDSVEASVEASVVDSVRNIFNERSYYGDISDFGWVSFYSFFTKTGILNNPEFNRYESFIRSTPFALYLYENCAFAVHPPVLAERNARGRLHSTTGPAVKFRDGSAHYFINGRSVPEWIIEEKESITKERFLSEKNAEIKGAVYETLGQKGVMKLLGAESVDTRKITHANGDTETVELLKTRERFPETGNEPFAWVRVVCPSTGTNYLLGVEPRHTNALEAVASLSPFDAKGYSYNKRS